MRSTSSTYPITLRNKRSPQEALHVYTSVRVEGRKSALDLNTLIGGNNMKILKFGVNRIDLKGNKLEDQIMEMACVTNVGLTNKERALFLYVEGELVTTLQITPEIDDLIKSNSDINLNKFTLDLSSLAFKVVVPKDAFSEIVNYYYYTPVLPGVDFKSLLASAVANPLKVDIDLNKLRSIASTTQDLIDIVNSRTREQATKPTTQLKHLTPSEYAKHLTNDELLSLIGFLEDVIKSRRNQ